MNNDSDKMYKALASAYAEQEGSRLKSEMEALNLSEFKYPDRLDKRIAWNIWKEKAVRRLIKYAPVAACLITALIIFTGRGYLFAPPNPAPIADTTPSQKYNLEFISVRLPAEYTVSSIGYDNGKAIYHIENAFDNKIIITVEASPDHPIDIKGLLAIDINGTEVYGVSKPDYSLLTYEKDDTIYTLTSKYNYLDLIEISEKIISI